MQHIKKLVVHYEDGQTDEWNGDAGYVRIDRTIVKDGDGKMERDVRTVSAGLSQYTSDWRRSH